MGQVLLTADDVTRRAHYRNAQRTLDRLLELGVVPIVNENDTVATDEIRFGDNDRLAALVAHLCTPTCWSCSPTSTASTTATRPRRARADQPRCAAPTTSPASAASRRRPGVGTGGMVTKVEAARIATGAGVPVVLTSAAAAAGPWPASRSAPVPRRPAARGPTRLLWLAHATEPAAGCASTPARSARSSSAGSRCCPAGITGGRPATSWRATRSTWSTPNGDAVARGLVNFDADELPGLLGRSTRELARELGPAYEREVVHRDDLVLL